MKVTLTPCRFWCLPLLWYWRNFTVPQRALWRYPSPWWWMLKWYFGEQRKSYLSRLIRVDGRAVGYCCIRANQDLGIYLGVRSMRGLDRKVGETSMRLLFAEAKRIGLSRLTAGMAQPAAALRLGFHARSEWIDDDGVQRLPLEIDL